MSALRISRRGYETVLIDQGPANPYPWGKRRPGGQLVMAQKAAPLPIPVTLIECDDRRVGGWERLAALDVRKIAASHAAMFQEPQMTTLVEALREVLP